MSDDHMSILSIQENHRVLLRSWNRQNQGAVSSNRLFTPIMLFRSFPHRLSCARLLSADDNIPSHTHKVSLSFFILFFFKEEKEVEDGSNNLKKGAFYYGSSLSQTYPFRFRDVYSQRLHVTSGATNYLSVKQVL